MVDWYGVDWLNVVFIKSGGSIDIEILWGSVLDAEIEVTVKLGNWVLP